MTPSVVASLRSFRSVVLVLLLAPACSSTTTTSSPSDGGPASSSPNAAKCKTACTLPSTGPCSTQDATPCTNDCVTLTEGLAAGCAQCIVEQTRWLPTKKPVSGGEATCDGYEVGKASSAECQPSCK